MIEINKSVADQMIAHALEDEPNECCGFVAGYKEKFNKVYRMTNVEGSPYRFSMDSRELFQVTREIEDNEWDKIIYHSHTHSEAYPSDTDVRLASYPDAYYLIVSLMQKETPTMRAFRIVDSVVSEVHLQVT